MKKIRWRCRLFGPAPCVEAMHGRTSWATTKTGPTRRRSRPRISAFPPRRAPAGCRPRICPRHRPMTLLPMDSRLAGNRERRSSARQRALTWAQDRRKPTMASAMTPACVSRAKCPVSRNRT